MKPLKNLSKGRFLMAQKCPLTAWRLRHREIEAIPEDDHFSQYLASQGHIIGEISTQWFDAYLGKYGKPPGVNIDEELERLGVTRANEEEWLQTSIDLTQEALNDPDVWAIYEATFNVSQTYTTRADILARIKGDVWNMIEVKSITEKRDRDYIPDMAYTTGILRLAGIEVKNIGLMRIDTGFLLDDVEQLEDIDEILDLLTITWKWQPMVEQTLAHFNANNIWLYVDQLTSSTEPPPPNFSSRCRQCPSCRKDSEDLDSILSLPNLGHMGNKFNQLKEVEIYHIRDIPKGFFSSRNSYEKTATIVTECVKHQKMYVSKHLQELLSTHFSGPSFLENQQGPIKWPVMYLDFETLSTAVPLFEDTKPYAQIPVQYSLHSASSASVIPDLFMPNLSTIQHQEFLADPAQDQRKELGLQLLEHVDRFTDPKVPDSTIFAYHAPVEKGCIKYLASLFMEDQPDIADRLLKISYRLVDLLKIIKGGAEEKPRAPNFYHPVFQGKFGLKSVIKFFAPSLYANLNISSGAAALAAYARLAYALKFPLTPWEADDFNEEKISADLIKYCDLDTYSMILIHQQLAMLAASCPECLPTAGIFRTTDAILCPECLEMIDEKQWELSHSLFCPGKAQKTTSRRR
jgi:hypothetical protein